MKTATFQCKILTPMFAGTAIPGQCEIRPPAIKGAIRFWWRALHGGMEVDDLRKKEAAIFGTSDQKIGRSKFSIEVREKEVIKWSKNQNPLKSQILNWLGYGTRLEKDGEPPFQADCFMPGTQFDIIFRFQDGFDLNQSLTTISAWERFGGMGLKNRNGFGQFEIVSYNGKPWKNQFEFRSDEGFSPAFHAFSHSAKLFETKTAKEDARQAHEEIGKVYKEARKALESSKTYARRVLVAQPMMELNKFANKSEPVNDMFLERHAKSMFIGIRREAEGYKGQILLMPYDYLSGITRDRFMTGKEFKIDKVDELKAKYVKVMDDLATSFKDQKLNPVTL